MSFVSNSSQSSGAGPLICSCVAASTILAIVFIVLGALGAHGTIYMAPIGAEVMITLGMTLILGMITAVVKNLCR